MTAAHNDDVRLRGQQDPIAIIGMACRLPGDNNSPHSLWNFLESGGCAATGAPASRFSLDGHFDGSRKRNTLKSPGAMFLENVDLAEFDARFFSISPQEAIAMDPQQRQLLEVTYECLENAGITLESMSGAPIGCYVASSTSDYRDIHARDPEDRPPNATVGLVPAILANRISHFFNLKGPSMTIDTACSASLVSLDVACKYMQSGETDAAVVAGVHLWLSPEANMDSGAMREAFSSSGQCHTFDADADGYIKAEGINAVLLKRLDLAIKDGDPIRAVIRGSATNSDGRTSGIANPSGEAQAAAIRSAYANAGIDDLAATGYLECHGTGTLAGDPVEVEAASSALCKKRDAEPLIIGSIKSNIGHSECSAGISGIIKTILSLERGVIPGNATLRTPNPKIDFTGLKVRASRTALPWPKTVLRRASVNSFGFGGSNAHVILEESKARTKTSYTTSLQQSDDFDDFFADKEEKASNAPSLLVFSANDERSLTSYVDNLKRHLMRPAMKSELADLAYTLSERRTHYFHRAFLITNQANFDLRALTTGKKDVDSPRIGFVFTGQGAQWPEMGKALVRQFALARQLLTRMDSVLQGCPSPPVWSLIDELTESRSAECLRQPALSQPLVTALQIVLVEILKSWGITPRSVVGHSSGEIAAAYCAGHISMDNAIKAAYYRGHASSQVDHTSVASQGMLAVGLGPQDASKYISDREDGVAVACYNSPKSVTLSGDTSALASIKANLETDGHFARLLQVDLAYHSPAIQPVADVYKSLLQNNSQHEARPASCIDMYSSVLGRRLDQEKTDAEYWTTNMTSPVQFERALRDMVQGRDSANFLVEIGPSGALAGPIAEIKTSLTNGRAQIQYCTALHRGKTNIDSLFEVAGRLFIAGGPVNFRAVNQRESEQPRVIVDLPNYAWNHTTKYWHESEASKDWRFRLFPPHDLIGAKVLGTSWHSPVWKKDLLVDEVSWLKDHKLGSDIVVPGAAMVVMAVEAMHQRMEALHIIESRPKPEIPCFRVRNATFNRALVLEEGKRQTVMTTLTARAGSTSWYEFKIRSLANGTWVDHSQGLVHVEEDRQETSKQALEPLKNSMPGVLWYQAMEDVGYALGPAFQKHLEAESLSGQRKSRSLISLRDPPSAYKPSRYRLHPTTVDAILQACAPALWNGNRTNIDAVIIPSIIDDMVIHTQPEASSTGMGIFSSSYTDIGDINAVKNYTADAKVYDVDTDQLLFELSKLRTSTLNTRAESHTDPLYCSLSWKPDIDFLSSQMLNTHLSSVHRQTDMTAVDHVIELISFKTPDIEVLECNMLDSDSQSLWLENIARVAAGRTIQGSFHYVHKDAKLLLAAQARYSAQGSESFSVGDMITSGSADPPKTGYDLLIVRARAMGGDELLKVVRNSRSMMRQSGRLLLVTSAPPDVSSSPSDQINGFLASEGFNDLLRIPTEGLSPPTTAFLCTASEERSFLDQSPHALHVLRFSPVSAASAKICESLKKLSWNITEYSYPFKDMVFDGMVLIMEDLSSSFLSNISEEHWAALQTLFASKNRMLWLTEGSQLDVTKPDNAPIHGLMRTIHDEEPSIHLSTLDLEDKDSDHAVSAINSILKHLEDSTFQKTGDYEYVERGGVIYTSRVLQDEAMNKFSKAEREGSELVKRPLHEDASQIRAVCEQVGNLDSLHFHDAGHCGVETREGSVSIKIAAAGLNFKDIAISTGLIPGNEKLLGFEGAGIIVESTANPFHAGQRVLFSKPGSFANSITVEADLVHILPDSVSFEEAATLGAVYPVALYSLFDLANIHKGQRVLIHSAAGGLGIACVQLCQYTGAEVFATVGNEDKRRMLTNRYGIQPSHIFNSRSVDFAAKLMNATGNEGVDVVINSLTGDLLEASWECIRDGGTMIELGKRDINERNYLPMEPFARNVSYRSFDISHKSVPTSTMARLLKQTFDLLEAGHIRPIAPMKVFGFDDITSAFRYMRDGKHMGKIVISNGARTFVEVPVRAPLKTVKLRQDASYLIVGGLKGLCGSLALSFARHGARHLTVMGRSGFHDHASQTVIANIEAEGCQAHLVKGDVTIKEDVERAFAIMSVAGVVQGAMVVRGKLYPSMTASDYHACVTPKTLGTWHLHNAALAQPSPLDFFTFLSSTSGIAGQSGQANYVAANAFLDAFALYRRHLGLRANSIALGPMWDVGYMSRNKESLPQTNTSTFTTISERLFHRIIDYSILQQTDPIDEATGAHLITGMAIPLKESSTLRSDARFSALFGSASSNTITAGKAVSKEMELFNLLFASQPESQQTLDALVDVVSQKLTAILQLNEPIEAAKSPSSYGMESLAAVELRNWIRMELGADVTMLELLNAASLVGLCGKVLGKMGMKE